VFFGSDVEGSNGASYVEGGAGLTGGLVNNRGAETEPVLEWTVVESARGPNIIGESMPQGVVAMDEANWKVEVFEEKANLSGGPLTEEGHTKVEGRFLSRCGAISVLLKRAAKVEWVAHVEKGVVEVV